MRLIFKVLLAVFILILLGSAVFSLLGAVLGITFGIIGTALGFVWRVIFSPAMLVIVIIWIIYKLTRKAAN